MRVILTEKRSKRGRASHELAGLQGDLTRDSLLAMFDKVVEDPDDPGSSSFGSFIRDGGEAFLRVYNGTVLRFEKLFLERKARAQERKLYKQKFAALDGMRSRFPKGTVIPDRLLYLAGDDKVIGCTMPYIEGFREFEELAPTWNPVEATEKLLVLHRYVTACHQENIRIGEFNWSNFGFAGGDFTFVDGLTFDIPEFPCFTKFLPTLDPDLIDPNEGFHRDDPRAWERLKPYSIDSDWFGFSHVVLATFCAPAFGGSLQQAKGRNEYADYRTRMLRGLSIFEPGVILPKDEGLPPEALSEPLYEYLYEVFSGKRRRGVFPEALLKDLRWTRCSSCGKMRAARWCPCG